MVRLALALLVSLSLFVIATTSPRLSPPRSDVVSQPPSKKRVPQILTDGTPVVVVSKSGSPPVVIEAIDTHVPFGVAGLVRWCEASDTYVSTFYSRWDRYGVKKGGPAVSGLATFDVSPIAGTTWFRLSARECPALQSAHGHWNRRPSTASPRARTPSCGSRTNPGQTPPQTSRSTSGRKSLRRS